MINNMYLAHTMGYHIISDSGQIAVGWNSQTWSKTAEAQQNHTRYPEAKLVSG